MLCLLRKSTSLHSAGKTKEVSNLRAAVAAVAAVVPVRTPRRRRSTRLTEEVTLLSSNRKTDLREAEAVDAAAVAAEDTVKATEVGGGIRRVTLMEEDATEMTDTEGLMTAMVTEVGVTVTEADITVTEADTAA